MAFAMGTAKYVPSPTITETTVLAYAHCPDPRCKGVVQQQVQAVRTLMEWTFASRGGGDDPGGIGNLFLQMVENSQEHLRFVDVEADSPCPHCDKPRELSVQPRPSYPISVGGANALLRLQDMGLSFDPDRQEKIAAGAPETPLELLQRRYISDEIAEDEFVAKRAMLAGGGPAASAVVEEVTTAQETRLAEMQEQINALLATLAGQQVAADPDRDATPLKRGPGRPRKEPDA